MKIWWTMLQSQRRLATERNSPFGKEWGHQDVWSTQERRQHAARMPGCCQGEARAPECSQDEARTPSECLKTPKMQPGSHQDSWIPSERLDAARMMPGRRHQKAWNGLQKVLTLTKWLFQVMNCVVGLIANVVEKWKYCALFYLLLSNLL